MVIILPKKTSLLKSGFAYWFVAGIFLFALRYFIIIFYGLDFLDESWFLQVVYRVTSGDVLYRDVFFPVTPLSVYVNVLFTTLLGTEILVIRAVGALCFTLIVLLSCRISQQLGSPHRFPILLVIALTVYALPRATSPYSSLASFFFLCCFSGALTWWKDLETESKNHTRRFRLMLTLILSGVSAGLCFASKQNLGLYALTALLLTIAVVSRGKRDIGNKLRFAIPLVLTAFLLSVVAVLLPVAFNGGIEKFVEYGFINKVNYIRFGSESYLNGLMRLVLFLSSPSSIEDLKYIYGNILFFLPPLSLTAISLVWIRARANERILATIVLLFTVAAFMEVFPRANLVHVVYVTPELILGLIYVWHRLKRSIRPHWVLIAQTGLLLWLGIGLGYLILNPFVRAASDKYQFSTLPHFRGAFIDIFQHTQIRNDANALVDLVATEQPVFLLSPNAGFYYLVTELKNPSPFDYPLVTAFGLNGEAEVRDAISSGKIRTVCLDRRKPSPLSPVLLERYIQEHMQRIRRVGFCTLYRARM